MDKPFVPDRTKNPDHGDRSVIEKFDSSKDHFFYIGKRSDESFLLAEALPDLLFFSSPGIIRSALNGSPDSGCGKTTPTAIFCSPHISPEAIQEIHHYLSSEPALGNIALILDGSGLSERTLSMHRKNKLFDEIIFPEGLDKKKLISKLNFLVRIRSRSKIGVPIEAPHRSSYFEPILKRTFDIVFASFFIILLSPLFLIIALVIKIGSGGPAFYISKRAGRGFRIFDLYKFRTMCTGADEKIADLLHLNAYHSVGGQNSSVFLKIAGDPRVNKVGIFLRNTSLDELPQLLNILLGDMSFVGNRPLPLYEAEQLTTDEWAKRFMAPAGLTGLWQIKKRGKLDMSAAERIGLDIEYADHCNFVNDLRIMAQTPAAMMQNMIC